MKKFKQYLQESLLDDEDELASPVNEVREFLNKTYKCSKEFEIDDSMSIIRVSTKGRVEISSKVKNISELTNGLFEFYETGDFIAWTDLTTLEGSPRHVHGTFNVCSSKLESLEGAPIQWIIVIYVPTVILSSHLKVLQRPFQELSIAPIA